MSQFKRRARLLAAAGVVVVSALAAATAAFGAGGQLGESSPIASNPNQQAITYGQQQAAKHYGWTVKTLDANLSADKQVSDLMIVFSAAWVLNLSFDALGGKLLVLAAWLWIPPSRSSSSARRSNA